MAILTRPRVVNRRRRCAICNRWMVDRPTPRTRLRARRGLRSDRCVGCD